WRSGGRSAGSIRGARRSDRARRLLRFGVLSEVRKHTNRIGGSPGASLCDEPDAGKTGVGSSVCVTSLTPGRPAGGRLFLGRGWRRGDPERGGARGGRPAPAPPPTPAAQRAPAPGAPASAGPTRPPCTD